MVPRSSGQNGADDAFGGEVRLRVLGTVMVSVGGEPVEPLLRHRKPLALFAYLALARSEKFFQRDHLCDVFWPDSTQRRARASLRQALATIRRALPDTLEALGGDAVRVAPGAVRSDVEDLFVAVHRGDWTAAADVAVGELFEGFHVPGAGRFEDWLDRLRTDVRNARSMIPGEAMAARKLEQSARTPAGAPDPPSPRAAELRATRPAFRPTLVALVAMILLILAAVNPFSRGAPEARLQPLVVLYPFEGDSDVDSAAALSAFARDVIALELRRRLAGVTVTATTDAGDVRRPDAIYVTGLLRSAAGPTRLELRLSDVEGEVIRLLGPAATDRTAPHTDLARLADEISVVAADRLLHASPSSRMTVLEDADLPRWEAYLAFERSREHAARNRYSLALPEAERAVELAPDWTEARLEWATHLANNGQPAVADSVLSSVVSGGAQLGPFQRVRADWLAAALDNDRRGRLRAQRARLELEGRQASIQLVYELLGLGRPGEALQVVDLLDPDEMIRREVFRYWTFTAQAHHSMGDYPSELAAVREGLDLFPEYPQFVRRQVASLAAMGRVDDVVDLVEHAASTFSQCCPLSVAVMAGDELSYHGWPDHAADAYQRGYELSHGPEYWEERHSEVLLLLRLERWREARNRLEPLIDDSSNRARDFGSMGVIASRLGEGAQAEAWLARLDPKDFHGTQRPEALLSRARITAAMGRDDAALTLLNEAAANGLSAGRGSHDPVFEDLRGRDTFVTWATLRGPPDSR